MTTNNEYLKSIAETVTETEISGTHTDNYYLKLICTTYGYTYTGTVCDGKLIKDFASYITSKTYNRIHFDNKYYHDIAESLTGNTYDNKYDNYYLGIIAENITPPTPVMTLDHIGVELIAGNQILSYADEQQTPDSQYATVRFVAYADAGETETIPNLSLDFKVGSGAVTTVTTDSDGGYEYTYHSQGGGDVEIVASKTVDGILLTKTYSLCDALYYKSNVSTGNVNIPVPSSNKWSVTYKMKHTSNGVYFNMADGNHIYFVGNFSSSGGNGVLIRNNGSSTNLVFELATDISLNTEYDVTITFDNGVWKYNHGTGEMTVTATSYIPTSISKFDIGGYIHDFILKPL